jgi:hypothetical protein
MGVGALHPFDEFIGVGSRCTSLRQASSRCMLRRQVVPRHVGHNESAWPVSPLIMSGLGATCYRSHRPQCLVTLEQ